MSEPQRTPSAKRPVIKYPPHTDMWTELNGRVQEYFESSGKRRDGGARLWVKTSLILAWLVASYVALVFLAEAWWQAIPAAVSLSFAVAAVGFNIQHDGGHDAFSSTPLWNRVSAWALDVVGGSSYIWKFKHSIVHHHYTNIEGVDTDIDAGPFMRLAPSQPRRRYHRFQHWYAWLLFGFLPGKWEFYDDFVSVISARVGSTPIPRPGPRDLSLLILGKLIFVGWALALPLLVGHSIGLVLGMYALCSLVTGICLAVVFQLAHCVEEADFDVIPPQGERMELAWAEHQLATTVDFAPRSKVLTWFLGGLNFQVEHHLFPRISHIHYPSIAPIVRETCAKHGVEYRAHARFWPALCSHVRHMRKLGQPVPATAAA